MTLASRFIRVAGIALPIILAVRSLPGQAVEPKDGSISGKVVNSATRQPVSGANLTLALAGKGVRMTMTADAQGNFSFDRVKPGRYLLEASKSGYARTTYGAASIGDPGRALTVVSDRGISGLEFRLIALVTIQGKVINRKGDPVPGVTIACGFVDRYGAPPWKRSETLRTLAENTILQTCRPAVFTCRRCLRRRRVRAMRAPICPHTIHPAASLAKLSRSQLRRDKRRPESTSLCGRPGSFMSEAR
jgi:hypothetical protein